MTETQTTPTCQPVKRGFANELICPRCGNDAIMRLDLPTLDVVTCRECDEEIEIDHIRALVASWLPILAWLDQAPVLASE